MLREKFAEIIGEALARGYQRGVDVFMENLEEDLAKSQVFEEVSKEDVISHLMESAGWRIDAPAKKKKSCR